jgi:hypothetical protein
MKGCKKENWDPYKVMDVLQCCGEVVLLNEGISSKVS